MIRYPAYKYFYAVLDFAVLCTSLYLAKMFYDIFYLNENFAPPGINVYELSLLLVSVFIFIFIFHYNNLYKLNVFLTRSLQISLILKSLLYGILVQIIFSFFLKIEFISDSRLYIALFFYVSFVMFLLVRVLLMRTLYREKLGSSLFRRRILVIGTGRSAKLFSQKMLTENELGVKIAGYVDDKMLIGTPVFRDIEVLGNTDELEDLRKSMNINEIVICLDDIQYDELLKIIDKCNKTEVTTRLTSDLFKIIPERMFSEHYTDIPVIDVTPKVNQKVYLFFKRIIDFTGAAAGILILSPFLLTASVLIKLSSKGPVIFRQKRIGRNGREFNFYKFRTMTVLEGEDLERQKKMLEFMKNGNGSLKVVNEKRITGIGKLLRKFSLDELPQLFNVLKGDMSLVGPRPCLPYEYENYDEWQKRRLSILPGCTGLWQVSGRSSTSFNDSVIMDIYYINNITPWLDIQLILKTLPVMLLAKGGK